ncbi:MAG: ABC-type transport auxiliary lipoprotein family protein [bacterium]
MTLRLTKPRLDLRLVVSVVSLASLIGFGCSPALVELPEQGPPSARYELSAPADDDENEALAEAPGGLVLVERPTARASLEDARIVVRSRSGEIRALAGARWTSPAPALLHDLLIATLDSDPLHATGESLGLSRGHLLSTRILAFHVSEGEGGLESVEVAIGARLLERSPTRLLRTTRLEAREPIERSEVEAVIAAFDRATRRVLEALRGWTFESIQREIDDESREER